MKYDYRHKKDTGRDQYYGEGRPAAAWSSVGAAEPSGERQSAHRETLADLQPPRHVADTADYAAFLSYSHAADPQLGPAVERGLERLGKKWYRRRVLNVFRDDSELGVSHALWPDIVAALERSNYFVLLASPEAARSEWVGREIEWWKTNKPVEHILLVIAKGECHWAAGDFDRKRSTAIPPALFGVFCEEPRWLDLSWTQEETHLDLQHGRFRDAIAQLASPIRGQPKADLEAEDVRQHRVARVHSRVEL